MGLTVQLRYCQSFVWVILMPSTSTMSSIHFWDLCKQCRPRSGATIEINYRKNAKISDTRKIAVIILKFERCGFTIKSCVQKMWMDLQIHVVDPDQTAPLIWVCTVCPDLCV